ncbi:MAG: glycoside hydrolase family 97 protein, partial [Chitinophagaceae bacterium]
MKLLLLLPLFAAMISQAQQYELKSPDGKQVLSVMVSTEGELSYELSYSGSRVINPSPLGIYLKEPSVALNFFLVLDSRISSKDETWQTTWGEYAKIRDQHKELFLQLRSRNGNNIRVNVVFRLFNEGLGFRYEFPKEGSLDHFIVDRESSSFALTGNHMAHWIPGDYDSNEFTYNHTR